jgi:hypothetical protein
VTLLEPNSPEALEAERRIGRLWDIPLVTLQPPQRPVGEFWTTAPAWLRDLARQPPDAVAALLWEQLREGFPTEVVPRVPVWVPEAEEGYVVDFLLPQVSVGVVIDRADPEAEWAWKWWGNLQADLQSVGIEPLGFFADVVREDPAECATEIRYELGIFDK